MDECNDEIAEVFEGNEREMSVMNEQTDSQEAYQLLQRFRCKGTADKDYKAELYAALEEKYSSIEIEELNLCKPLSGKEVLVELVQARESYENGEGEDFDYAVDEISAKYGL